MRLIDADELKATRGMFIYQTEDADVIATEAYRWELIEREAPTVKAIPLDKPFCKMVYGDYVVYNKKWLVNHLQTEWNILQGKEYKPAIPVEWIEKWVITKFVGAGRVIDSMIEDWEKENDKGSE